MITRILLSLSMLFAWAHAESIKSITGNIIFDIDSDGTSEAKLTSDGLAIGAGLSPSSNLHVQGNVINTGDLVIGGAAGNSTLEIQGTIGYNTQTISSNTTLSGNSIILVDTSSDNVTVTLPEASIYHGRLYSIKKISSSNDVTVSGTMDNASSYTLTSGNTQYLKIISNGSQYYVLSMSDGVSAIFPLFADNFNRADNLALNVVDSGKSGSLGNLDWVEVVSVGDPQIASNQFKFGESGSGGGGWSIAYVDHNFIDASITTNGGFTVTVDLVSPNSGGGTRFTGFAVGHSKAELDAWSSNNPTSFVSDFFFGYDTTGTKEVKVFIDGGTEDHQLGTDLSAGATLSVKFSSISDFNSGSSVSYEAFIDGSSIKTGSFTWSGNNENYITLYSNYTSHQGLLDNLEVKTP